LPANKLQQSRQLVAAPVAAPSRHEDWDDQVEQLDSAELNSELRAVIDAWSGLPHHLKAAILAIVGQVQTVPK
jgi:hypothetical protein